MVETAWVALSLARQLGGKTFRSLLDQFNHDLDAILAADEQSLRAVPGIGSVTAKTICQIDLEQVALRIARWEQAGVRIITWNDPAYPAVLKELDDAPPTLFVRGSLPSFAAAVAIVGTRRPSSASWSFAADLAHTVVKAGGVVVSGLAMGVDHAAHMGALTVQGINTAAVLGSGVLNLYPRENRKLAEAIMGYGAIISEVAPDSSVSTPGLVARNRLITGLSQAVMVVETEISGGAMHAARFARLQGRALYTLDIDASGNQALLADGALPVDALLEQFEGL